MKCEDLLIAFRKLKISYFQKKYQFTNTSVYTKKSKLKRFNRILLGVRGGGRIKGIPLYPFIQKSKNSKGLTL